MKLNIPKTIICVLYIIFIVSIFDWNAENIKILISGMTIGAGVFSAIKFNHKDVK